MKHHDKATNNLLVKVADRFLANLMLVRSANPIVKDSARKMCDIALLEMWMLTQD